MTEETVLYRGLDQAGDYVEYVYVPGAAEKVEKEAQGPTLRRTVLPVPQQKPLTSTSSSRTIEFLQSRRVLIINSLTSGLNQSTRVYERVVQPVLAGLGVNHEYVPTRNAHTIADTAAALAAERDYLVIIFGGDTSLSEFVNALPPDSGNRSNNRSGSSSSSSSNRVRRGRIELVLVPTGTGNAISASSIGGGKNAIAKTLATLFNSAVSETTTPALQTSAVAEAGKPTASQNEDVILATVTATPAEPTFVPLPTFRVDFPPGSYVAAAGTTNAADAAAVAAATSPHRLELYSVVVVSWALHAALVADSDLPEYRALGVARFRKAAEINLARAQRYAGKIALLPLSSAKSGQCTSSGSIKLSGDASTHSYVLFTLVSQVEQGYLISPSTHYGAADDDGSGTKRPSLHFLRIPFTLPNNANNAELARLVILPYQAGAHVTDPNVDYIAVNPSSLGGTGDSGDAGHDDDDDNNGDGVAGVITAASGEGPQRWCVDGQIVVVPDAAGPVIVHGARHGIATANWDLYILV
ncbi:hypothetical protein D0Z00_001913 [Geotrichum galactomycetum]|uniref:Uncharacterized protein n=1 Tax=Geotrichum galactomycetum TaxID=27317 RepID=A0ACB6V5R8_9ASCO|nr:hypothetical protein D0Z00_001913 [Geotrichum candidum]